MWRATYLAKLPRISKRIRVGTDWLLDLAFDREIVELPLARTAIGSPEPARK